MCSCGRQEDRLKHTHVTALSVRIYAAISKQHSNIFQKKIPISWYAEAVLMSGGGLIHLVLMLAFNF